MFVYAHMSCYAHIICSLHNLLSQIFSIISRIKKYPNGTLAFYNSVL